MNEKFERLSVIKPWKNVKFNLNKTLEDVPKREIRDRRLIKKKYVRNSRVINLEDVPKRKINDKSLIKKNA